MPRDVVVLFARPEGRKLIERHCRKAHVRVADLRQLVDLEIDQVGRDRKRDLWPAFDEVFDALDDEVQS
jgi:hypothetical protein